MSKIKNILIVGFENQVEQTSLWHKDETTLLNLKYDDDSQDKNSDLEKLITLQHAANYSLWHIEDIARRKDVDSSVIADCKYRIDKCNQRRNNLMEKIDQAVIELLEPLLPETSIEKYNSETLGMCVDRMSILALKAYHMHEEVIRSDAAVEHIEKCTEKLSVLKEQRDDLKNAMFDIIDSYLEGSKRPKVYFQFKMYNDESLNPELYSNVKAANS